MFYKYEIRKLGNKNALYLYMSSTEEEADEFKSKNTITIKDQIENFIKKCHINYSEGPVYIISNGIIIKSIDIKNKNINIEELIEKDLYSNEKFIVRVKSNDKITILSLKDYLIGAILTRLPYDSSVDLIKAIAILYRTYIYKQMAKDGFILSNDKFIKYVPLSYYKLLWFHDFNDIIRNLEKAIIETDCIFITYNNLFIKPYIHEVNNGNTDTIKDIPYLTSVKSLWDLASPKYMTITNYSINEIAELLNTEKTNIFDIKILELTDGGNIKKIKIGYKIYDGNDFIEKLKLPSKDMTILVNDNNITFINRGYGNNLGLSLQGSKFLIEAGCNYLQVLNYYFPKCKIKKYI